MSWVEDSVVIRDLQDHYAQMARFSGNGRREEFVHQRQDQKEIFRILFFHQF